VGLVFQQALSSSLLGGVGTDAAYIAARLAAAQARRLPAKAAVQPA
jgi:hypothetical protein